MAGNGRSLVFLARRRANLLQSSRSNLPEDLRQPLLLYQSLVDLWKLLFSYVKQEKISTHAVGKIPL